MFKIFFRNTNFQLYIELNRDNCFHKAVVDNKTFVNWRGKVCKLKLFTNNAKLNYTNIVVGFLDWNKKLLLEHFK